MIKLDDGSSFDQRHRVLYVLDPNHVLSVRNKSIAVNREDGTEVIAIPRKRIGRIEIGPEVALDQKAVTVAMDADLAISILDGFGQTRGLISGRGRRTAKLQLAQAKAVLDDTVRLEVARRCVESRIRNQRTQLFRLNRKKQLDEVGVALVDTKRTLRQLASATSIEALRGHEGHATALYFAALRPLLPESNGFARSRPARDPINAVINYLTGILERDIRAAIQAVGLHQGFAFLHTSQDRHDGLVFDMMEPFRAPLTEGLSVFLFSSKRLREDMFVEGGDDGVHIKTEGRRAIVKAYEAAVAKRVNAPDGTGKLRWRKMMLHQSRSVARAVLSEDPTIFCPYLMEA